jgi:hypothetical protein
MSIIPIAVSIFQGNRCPICQKYHRAASRVGEQHAKDAAKAGIFGYDYDHECWAEKTEIQKLAESLYVKLPDDNTTGLRDDDSFRVWCAAIRQHGYADRAHIVGAAEDNANDTVAEYGSAEWVTCAVHTLVSLEDEPDYNKAGMRCSRCRDCDGETEEDVYQCEACAAAEVAQAEQDATEIHAAHAQAAAKINSVADANGAAITLGANVAGPHGVAGIAERFDTRGQDPYAPIDATRVVVWVRAEDGKEYALTGSALTLAGPQPIEGTTDVYTPDDTQTIVAAFLGYATPDATFARQHALDLMVTARRSGWATEENGKGDTRVTIASAGLGYYRLSYTSLV